MSEPKDAMIPKPGETPGEWWGNTGHPEAKRQQNLSEGRRADVPFDPLIDFFHDVPQPVVDKALTQGEPRQSDSVFCVTLHLQDVAGCPNTCSGGAR